MFRFERESSIKLKTGKVVKLAPKLRKDFDLFDKEKNESVYVEGKLIF